MIFLCNAFAVSMLRYPLIGEDHPVSITRISAHEAGEILRGSRFVSVYGHRGTAWHLARYLQLGYVPVCREAIRLTEEDTLIVAKAAMDREYKSGERKAPKWSFYRIRMCNAGAGPAMNGAAVSQRQRRI